MGKPKKTSVSYWNSGMAGLHLTINPRPPIHPSARVYRRFLRNGLVLSSDHLQTLMDSRTEGINGLSTLIGGSLPFLTPKLRLKLAESIADALLDKSLDAHLSREAPTLLDLNNAATEALEHRYGTPPAFLSDRLGLPQGSMGDRLLRLTPPVGVSLTIHF